MIPASVILTNLSIEYSLHRRHPIWVFLTIPLQKKQKKNTNTKRSWTLLTMISSGLHRFHQCPIFYFTSSHQFKYWGKSRLISPGILTLVHFLCSLMYILIKANRTMGLWVILKGRPKVRCFAQLLQCWKHVQALSIQMAFKRIIVLNRMIRGHVNQVIFLN